MVGVLAPFHRSFLDSFLNGQILALSLELLILKTSMSWREK